MMRMFALGGFAVDAATAALHLPGMSSHSQSGDWVVLGVSAVVPLLYGLGVSMLKAIHHTPQVLSLLSDS